MQLVRPSGCESFHHLKHARFSLGHSLRQRGVTLRARASPVSRTEALALVQVRTGNHHECVHQGVHPLPAVYG